MVSCVIKDWQGQEAGETSFDLRVAKEESASHVVHRALVRQMNNARQGNASSKTRAEVRGGGRKPWRQKGTGRARAGSSRSPLWKGGGVIFGPKPRDYSSKMNKKERQLAMGTAFQSRLEDLVVVQDFSEHISRPKTKEMAQALRRWGVDENEKALLITSDKNETVYLSVRNIERTRLITVNNLNIYDLLFADKVVVTQSALEKIQEVSGV
jgi:large subunit ribosomal protein L4